LFQCESDAGHQFDVRRAIDDRDRPGECPRCGGDAARVFTACAIRQPCIGWCELTARNLLGPDDEAARNRVTVTKGMAKPVVR
jgi:putative FmdB family regulatory protein